jgi:uncharacterized protein
MKKIKKVILIVMGTISLILGTIGIFLPLLPTTPFLLLSAACYIRSSQKFYELLINNKYLGAYIKDYHEKGAVPRKTKVIALCFLWLSIGGSAFFVIRKMYVNIILFVIAVTVTIHILRLKNLEENVEDNIEDNKKE